MKQKTSSWTDDLQNDLYAWLDDKRNECSYNEIEAVMDLPETIESILPSFVMGWTVKELVAAIQDYT